MEGGEDISREPVFPAYLSSVTDCPVNVMSVNVESSAADGGGVRDGDNDVFLDTIQAKCCSFDGDVKEEVATIARHLHCLDDIGNREEFHKQCCEVSCCTAKEVIEIMRNRSYKVSLLQIASEIFLLQDLLSPTHYSCTEELLNSWLLVQEDKDQGNSAVLENINKMLALVESMEHLVIFLRCILKRFGSRFLGLCTNLALRVLKQQRHMSTMDNSLNDDGSSRRKLAQTLELVGQMYFGKRRQIYLSCLLTLLYVDPSDQRYFALESFFNKSADSVATNNVDCLSVDHDVYADLLHTINQLRPMSLDLALDWPRLKAYAIDLLFRAGYRYEPTSNTFSYHALNKTTSDWGFLGKVSFPDGSSLMGKATSLESNGEQVGKDGRRWCTSNAFMDENKTRTFWDVSSQNLDNQYVLFRTVKVESATAAKGLCGEPVRQNGSSHEIQTPTNELPDSTSADVNINNDGCIGGKLDCTIVNGSVNSNGIDTSEVAEQWKGGARLCSSLSNEDEGSNPLSIACAGDEDTNSIGEELKSSGVGSAFAKKRSASAEIISLSNDAVEPCQKSRVMSASRTKIFKKVDEGTEEKRVLRTTSRTDQSRSYATRKTAFLKYNFSKKLHLKESGKRSVSESEAADEPTCSLPESKITLPNGVKLKKCFIRLDRLKTVSEKQSEEDRSNGEESLPPETDVAAEATLSETAEIKDEPTEEKVVQCVCDGCGEVVPDCSWLTAHIVTCTGRPECGNTDAIIDEELNETFQADAPMWDPMGNGSTVGAENAIEIVPGVDGRVDGTSEGVIQMETSNEVAPFASQNSADVDAANLMHLLQNQDNASSSPSFIYDPSTSEPCNTLKVIQMSDGTSFSVAAQQNSVLSEISEEQYGKEVFYNGVYMYEFTEYQCDMCLLAFASHSTALNHVQSSDHPRSTISRNTFCCCLKCSIRYREKHIMWLHVLYMCGSAVDETVTDETRMYRCLLCCKAFLSAAFLRRHVCLQHGRDLGFSTTQRQIVDASTDGISLMSHSSSLNDSAPVASRLTDYRVGLDGQLIGTWNCYQVNEGITTIANQAQRDRTLNVFPMQVQETAETNLKQFSQNIKIDDRGGAAGVQDAGTAAVSGESGSADSSQALLDLACSIVLGDCSPATTNFADSSVNASHPAPAAIPAAPAVASAAPAAAAPSSKSAQAPNAAPRRTAKGIMYKNVFMQCIVNYLCSTCKKDLSTKASKKEHKSSPCFDADSRRFTYLRQYSYLCPYCSEKFPSQKFCRQHQLSVCLQLMGVKTDELNHKQLLCPFCDRKYFNIITLKGHMTLIHKISKLESNQILGTSGLLDELISFAPEGLSEKAKDAKKKTKEENERRKLETKKSPIPKETSSKKSPVLAKGILLTETKSGIESKDETGAENIKQEKSKTAAADSTDGTWVLQKPGSSRADPENGASHDSGLECNIADNAHSKDDDVKSEDVKDEMDQSELFIVQDADETDELTCDANSSNDVSTADEMSELEDLSCETDNVLVMNESKESQFDETSEEKEVLKRKNSKKSTKKVTPKSNQKLH